METAALVSNPRGEMAGKIKLERANNFGAVRRMRIRLSLPIDKAIYAAESCCHSNGAASRFVLKPCLEIR